MPADIKFTEKDGAKMATMTVHAPGGRVRTFGVIMKPGTRAQVEKSVRKWASVANKEIAHWSAAGNGLAIGADPDAPMSPTFKATRTAEIKSLAKKLKLDPDAPMEPTMLRPSLLTQKSVKKKIDPDEPLVPKFMLKRPKAKVYVDPASIKIVPIKKKRAQRTVVRVQILPAKLQAIGTKKPTERIATKHGVIVSRLNGIVGGEGKGRGKKRRGRGHCIRLADGTIKQLKIFHCPRAKAAIGAFAPSPSFITEDEVRGVIDVQEKAALIRSLKKQCADAIDTGAKLIAARSAAPANSSVIRQLGADMSPPRFVDDALHEEQQQLFAKGGESAMDQFLQDSVFGDPSTKPVPLAKKMAQIRKVFGGNVPVAKVRQLGNILNLALNFSDAVQTKTFGGWLQSLFPIVGDSVASAISKSRRVQLAGTIQLLKETRNHLLKLQKKDPKGIVRAGSPTQKRILAAALGPYQWLSKLIQTVQVIKKAGSKLPDAKGGDPLLLKLHKEDFPGDMFAGDEIIELSELEAGPSAALAHRLLKEDKELMRYKKVKGYDVDAVAGDTKGMYSDIERHVDAEIFGGAANAEALYTDIERQITTEIFGAEVLYTDIERQITTELFGEEKGMYTDIERQITTEIFGGMRDHLDEPDQTLYVEGIGFITEGELLIGAMVGHDNLQGTVGWFYDVINRKISSEIFGQGLTAAEVTEQLFETERVINPEEEALRREEGGGTSVIGKKYALPRDIAVSPGGLERKGTPFIIGDQYELPRDIVRAPGGLVRKGAPFVIGDYQYLTEDLLVNPGGLTRNKHKVQVGTDFSMPTKYFTRNTGLMLESNQDSFVGWTPPREIAGAIEPATSPQAKASAAKQVINHRAVGPKSQKAVNIARQGMRTCTQNIAAGYARRCGIAKPTKGMVLRAGAVCQKLAAKHGVPTTISGFTAYDGDVVGIPVDVFKENSKLGSVDSFLYYLNPLTWFRSEEINSLYLAKRAASDRKEAAEELKKVSSETRRAWDEVSEIEDSLAEDIEKIASARKGESRTEALRKLRSGVLLAGDCVVRGAFSLGTTNLSQLQKRVRAMVQESRMLAGIPQELSMSSDMGRIPQSRLDEQKRKQRAAIERKKSKRGKGWWSRKAREEQQKRQQRGLPRAPVPAQHPQPTQQPRPAQRRGGRGAPAPARRVSTRISTMDPYGPGVSRIDVGPPSYAQPAYGQQPYYPEQYGYQDPYAQQYQDPYGDPYAQQYQDPYGQQPAYAESYAQPMQYAQETYPTEYYQQDPYGYDPYAGQQQYDPYGQY